MAKAFVAIFICIGIFLLMQALFPKALAYKHTSNVDEIMVEDKRTHTRQNYVVQRALENDMFNDQNNIGPKYTVDSLPDPGSSEELPEFIVDYANMIRNDIVLLDNSVETRTRKRGNIKVEKYNQDLPDITCSCEKKKVSVNLSEEYGLVYPTFVVNITCNQSMCKPHFTCKESVYHMPILKRKSDIYRPVDDEYKNMPQELQYKWMSINVPVITGCYCTSSYLMRTPRP